MKPAATHSLEVLKLKPWGSSYYRDLNNYLYYIARFLNIYLILITEKWALCYVLK